MLTVLRRADGDPLRRLPRVDAYYLRSADLLRRVLTGELDHWLTLRRWWRAARR